MMNNENMLALCPVDGHKSFYGKCSVIFRDGKSLLRSYNTIVAEYSDKDGFKRLWNSYSATTMRHINAFRVYCGLETISKKEWCAL